MDVTNTPAYHDKATITDVKSFMVQGPDFIFVLAHFFLKVTTVLETDHCA